MKAIVTDKFAECVGSLWKERQRKKTASSDEFFVAAPLSSTPLPVFQWIIDNAAEFPAWERVRFVLMDEQVEGVEGGPFTYVNVNDSAQL